MMLEKDLSFSMATRNILKTFISVEIFSTVCHLTGMHEKTRLAQNGHMNILNVGTDVPAPHPYMLPRPPPPRNP